VREFALAVVSSLMAAGMIELLKLLWAQSKGGDLMFPDMAKNLPA
jgi:hypothetical protein